MFEFIQRFLAFDSRHGDLGKSEISKRRVKLLGSFSHLRKGGTTRHKRTNILGHLTLNLMRNVWDSDFLLKTLGSWQIWTKFWDYSDLLMRNTWEAGCEMFLQFLKRNKDRHKRVNSSDQLVLNLMRKVWAYKEIFLWSWQILAQSEQFWDDMWDYWGLFLIRNIWEAEHVSIYSAFNLITV